VRVPIRIGLLLARDWWSPHEDADFVLHLLNEIANWTFWRNNIRVRVELRLITETTRPSSLNLEDDIDALENGAIEAETLLRSSTKLDVVAWMGSYLPGTGGKARPCNGLLSFQPSYIAVDSRYALERFGLLHELGHLLGLGHESGNTSNCDTSKDARAFVSKKHNWHTIMGDPQFRLWERALSYLSFLGVEVGSVALPIWSGSGIEYPGEPNPDPNANNAKYLRGLSGSAPTPPAVGLAAEESE
jgi:hypothetical protein